MGLAVAVTGAVVGIGSVVMPASGAPSSAVHPIAGVFTDPATHHRYGVVPAEVPAASPGAMHSHLACENADCTALSYYGGPVQHAENDYLIFWTPSGHAAPSAYRAGMSTFLSELAAEDYTAGNPVSVNQQYYDHSGPGGAKKFVPYDIKNGGSFVDTHSYPTSGCTDKTGLSVTLPICLTDAQLTTELSSYVTAHRLPKGINTEYFILTPPNVGSCFDSSSSSCAYTGYCGYHSYIGSGSTQIVYANMPWAYGVSGCDINVAFGAGYPNADGIDPVVGIFSHELSETMTDPNLNAWKQGGTGVDAGYEIGDKCAYIYGAGGYGSLSGLANNGLGYHNLNLGTDSYLLQSEFDNRLASCAMSNTDTKPSASISVSPATPVHGTSAKFTAAVTDPNTPITYQWSFGDGSTATVNPAKHTYAKAGKYTVTLIVTDGHGSEVRVTKGVTVS